MPYVMFVLVLRVEFLEMENKKLGNQIFQMSNQLFVLERSLQNAQLLHFAEVSLTLLFKKMFMPQCFNI